MKKRVLTVILSALLGMSLLAGCGTSPQSASTGDGGSTITMVWLPNEAGDSHKAAREEFSTVIEKATGKKVEHKLTTDYAITIETIANNKAAIAWLGPQGYIEANKKNSTEKSVPWSDTT